VLSLSRELLLELAARLIQLSIAGSTRGIDPMKCRFAVTRLGLSLLFGMAGVMPGWAQQQGYMAPNFSQMSGRGPSGPMHQASQIPAFMASPLAGGPAAAGGGQFVDIHGNSIVMPASYGQCVNPGYGPCPDGMGGGYCDPMAVDFGGCSEDQIGPHYFDVAADVVYVKPDELFSANVPAFTSLGVGAAAGETVNPFNDPSGQEDEYKPGWRIAVRFDLGPLSVFEAAYTGIYDLDFDTIAVSSDLGAGLSNQLFSIFSQYGFDPAGFIDELDEAEIQTLQYDSDLQSTELTFRRYWVGNSSRVSGTWLLGARYMRLTEGLRFDSQNLDASETGFVSFDTENDLVGFQLGGDGWLGVLQGLRVGVEGKAGVYNNRFTFDSATDVDSVPANLQPSQDGNQVAFIGEGGVSVVADIYPSWSITGGYHVYYMNELVLVGNNISTTQFASVPVDQPALSVDGHALYHGFSAGVEYVW
jgi:hypothetical protein